MNSSNKRFRGRLMMLMLLITFSSLFLIKAEEYPFILIPKESTSVPAAETENPVESMVRTETEGFFYNAPSVKPEKVHIIIHKAERNLELYGDGRLIGRFRIALGASPVGHKQMEGDSKTPEGSYYICTRLKESKFTLFLGLSYPNVQDAKQGLGKGAIDRDTSDKIKYAIEHRECPPWNTSLGGAIGIHGGGNSYDWTLGCIALSDDDIRIIWQYASMGTAVEIIP